MTLVYRLPRHDSPTCRVEVSYEDHVENHTLDGSHKEIAVEVPEEVDPCDVMVSCVLCDNSGASVSEPRLLELSEPSL